MDDVTGHFSQIASLRRQAALSSATFFGPGWRRVTVLAGVLYQNRTKKQSW
jgi:hypothetical protein